MGSGVAGEKYGVELRNEETPVGLEEALYC
jgi:hypothetical protein